ncbi:type II toxin-antitoxin system PemK/MazF family toxin [Methylobacterium sp. J-077]|uniref:type II toxin-antitoxin system PemK/MazF family toxin n=1 Tax=Methylobacterium sp. J-077 TaxID=2836656 RepID=UPI001FB9BF42|nr:type II toxin-antitoxin system PemK/MazF family toxin [Methylobacterium sp. J-077]MCJ2125640.1 type II toxin-antitoxin system PemK/MazF family toxin [Methylobacterium sp. J-077]
MDFERYDVLTALFPFIDVPVRKPRPVVVLSNGSFNSAHGQVVAAMITTGADSHWPSDVPIIDLAAAGLRHGSVIRCKLFTPPNSQIGRRIGHLAEPDGTQLALNMAAIPGVPHRAEP